MSNTVYRGFSQEQLDIEYNAAAYVADSTAYFDEYIRRSSNARRNLVCSCDIPYGPAEGETLDIFYPRTGSNAPVHIFFHGGGYRSQDKFNFSFVAAPILQEAAIAVVPNYGLAPVVSMDEIIRQSRACIAWVYRNARTMGGDPNAITISGHSAGAHIVARALEASWAEFERTPEDVIKAAIAISGLYDQEARRLSFLNQFLNLDRAESLRNSCHYRTPRRRVPFVLAVSDGETSEYVRQTRDYADALNAKSYEAQFMFVKGFNHYNILDAFADASNPLGGALREHLRLSQALGGNPAGFCGSSDK